MNAVQTVRAVTRAQATVTGWSSATYHAVTDLVPSSVLENDHTRGEWATTVEVLRQPGETPVDAAHRLRRYMDLHAERWDHTPTLKALRASLTN